MTPPPPMLFLDFDGVLFDTVREAYVMARYAYSGEEVDAPVDELHYKRFYAVRYMIIHAWHYRIQMEMLEHANGNSDIKSFEKSFRKYVQCGKRKKDEDFEKIYFERRRRMMEENYDEWMALSRPYPFLDYVRPLFGSHNYVKIITSKNRDAVVDNLKWHGVSISPANVLDRNDIEKAGDKGRLIYREMIANSADEALFIDDNPDNFAGCSEVRGLRCLTAGWGYTSPECKGFSESQIISILFHQSTHS